MDDLDSKAVNTQKNTEKADGADRSGEKAGRESGSAAAKSSRFKQIAAVIGIILLVGMYVLTLISAIIGSDGTGAMFRRCLAMTIAVPIILWIIIYIYGRLTDKSTIADLNILNSNPKERAKMEEAVQNMEEQNGGGNAGGRSSGEEVGKK